MTEITADQILAMTPAQATEHLATLVAEHAAATRPPAVAAPTTPAEARARMAALAADPKWSTAYLNGDVEARREFQSVTALIADGNEADLALAGVVPENLVDFGPGASVRDQAKAVPNFREMGIRDEVIREVLEDRTVSQHDHDMAENWRNLRLKDSNFVKQYLSGDGEAVRLMTLANIVLTAAIKKT